MRRARHAAPAAMPDPAIAFTTGTMLYLGWSSFLSAPDRAIGWPVMGLCTFGYALLWIEPRLRPRQTRRRR